MYELLENVLGPAPLGCDVLYVIFSFVLYCGGLFAVVLILNAFFRLIRGGR